jgi:hypothetical protein
MVFLVDRYSGHFFCSAYSKHERAKPWMDSSVLYMPIATPAAAAMRYRGVGGVAQAWGRPVWARVSRRWVLLLGAAPAAWRTHPGS